MAYQTARILMTVSEFEGSFFVTSDKMRRAVPLHLQTPGAIISLY